MLDMAAKQERANIPRIGPTAVERADTFEKSVLDEIERATGAVPNAVVAAVVKIAAMQYATCQDLFYGAEGERQTMTAAGTLGNGARQNLVAAWNLAIKSAPSPEEDDDAGLDEFEAARPAGERKRIYKPRTKASKKGEAS